MDLNLFALCGDTGTPVVKRVLVSQDVQQQLGAFFQAVEDSFRSEVTEEIAFDGRWKPDRDQLMRMDVTDEVVAVAEQIEGDALAVEALTPATFEDESIRALAVRSTSGGRGRLLLQSFSNLQRLSRRFAVITNGEVFNRLDQTTFAIDSQLHVIVESGYIKFKSYNMAKRIFDLSSAYREATDQDITRLCEGTRTTGDAEAIIRIANPSLRKLISSVRDSDVFEENSADDLRAKAFAVNLDLPLADERVVLPSDKAELRKVLTFLDHGVYLSPLNQQRFIANSRRLLP